ncbi:MAG TPA: hypothetical protein VL614_03040 [Acetobacteraceae bacterium]|jgi:hypothetical protein|nr:hypothetical protein [Acetobacteraceae bacterium]
MSTLFIIRNDGQCPGDVEVKLRRRSPGSAQVDWFVLGDPETVRGAGHHVVALHDGWYADDTGGGVAVFGPYWEIRDTPFTVREVAPDPAPLPRQDGHSDEIVNVRRAIFGA